MNVLDVASRIREVGGMGTRNFALFSSVDSTNGLGKRFASHSLGIGENLSPTVLMALEQTAGRGRRGNRWLSPRGGIYVSLILPVESHEELVKLPMRIGIALCREVDRLIPDSCRVKWPNDLVVAGKKIGGVLIEGVGRSRTVAAVIGFGINYSTTVPGLAATTMKRESPGAPPLADVAVRLVRAIDSDLARARATREIVKEYSHWSVHRIGERLVYRTSAGIRDGEFRGFDPGGFLRIGDGDDELLVGAGEIIESSGLGHHDA